MRVDDLSPILHRRFIAPWFHARTKQGAERGQDRSEGRNEQQLGLYQDLPTADPQRLIGFGSTRYPLPGHHNGGGSPSHEPVLAWGQGVFRAYPGSHLHSVTELPL